MLEPVPYTQSSGRILIVVDPLLHPRDRHFKCISQRLNLLERRIALPSPFLSENSQFSFRFVYAGLQFEYCSGDLGAK